MSSVIKVGLDVHKNSFTAAVYNATDNDMFCVHKMEPSSKVVKMYVEELRERFGQDADIECGYEAGCLGYTLQRELESMQISCVILAPSTMAAAPTNKKKKTDSRDAETIARCLANKTYSAVHIPTLEDEATRDYIRMRNDLLKALKQTKMQIHAFCLRKGKQFTDGKSHWTQKHLDWLRKLELSDLDRETLDEYLMTLDQLQEKIARMDKQTD